MKKRIEKKVKSYSNKKSKGFLSFIQKNKILILAIAILLILTFIIFSSLNFTGNVITGYALAPPTDQEIANIQASSSSTPLAPPTDQEIANIQASSSSTPLAPPTDQEIANIQADMAYKNSKFYSIIQFVQNNWGIGVIVLVVIFLIVIGIRKKFT